MPRNGTKPRFLLSVMGLYESGVAANEPQVSVNLLAGTEDHLVYAGTFTLGEPEYEELVRALRAGLKGRLDIAVGPLGGEAGRQGGRRPRRRPARAA